MIHVRFFGSLREAAARDEMLVEAGHGRTVADLRQHLIDEGIDALADARIASALNQEVCSNDRALADGDEVAFFPPVTGG